MKKLLSLIAISLLAIPAFAQDDFGGFDTISGADLEALFGDGGGNRGNRGGRGNNNIPNPETMFLDLRDLLKAKKVPLSKDQEKSLRTLLDTETQSMRQTLEAQFGNRGNNNQNNQNNQNNRPNPIAELFKIVSKHNTELLTSMKAELAPDQASLLTKAEKDKKACTVLLDLVNPQQLQNRGGRGNNNFDRGGFDRGGFDGGFELGGFDRGGFDRGGRRGGNNFADQIPDRQFCTSAASTTAERLAPVAQILTKGKKPLTPDQEKKFSELIEAKLPVMEEEIRSTDSQIANLLNQLNNQNRNNNNNNNPQQLRNNIVNTIMSQLGIPNNNNNNNRGNRGGNNNNATANNNNQGRGNRGNNFNIQAEIQKKNEELLDKVAASLNADQQPIVKKLKYDQIKAKGGADRYRAILEEEGTPLTPEQYAQIQALFNSENQAVRQFADQLVQKELANAPQQPPAQPDQQNRNQNNVNQNPLAQQIVAKLLPQVSVQHARLEKVTQDTILKLLTPPQVASYKLNSL